MAGKPDDIGPPGKLIPERRRIISDNGPQLIAKDPRTLSARPLCQVVASADHRTRGGEPLGLFIRELRASVSDFDAWVLATPQEEIDRAIVEAARAQRVEP